MTKYISSIKSSELLWLATAGAFALLAFTSSRLGADDPPPCNNQRYQPNQACPGKTQTAPCSDYKPLGAGPCNAARTRLVYQNNFECKGNTDPDSVKYNCFDYTIEGVSLFVKCTRTYQCYWNASDGNCLTTATSIIALNEDAVLKAEDTCLHNNPTIYGD